MPLREDQQEYGKLVRQDASEWEQGSRDVKEGLPPSLIALFTFLEHTLVRKRITSRTPEGVTFLIVNSPNQ